MPDSTALACKVAEATARRGLEPALIVVLAGVSAALHVGKLPPALPVLQDTLGLSLVQSGFLVSLVQLAGMGLGLLVGLAGDGLGLRRCMVAGLLILSTASVAGGFADGAGAVAIGDGVAKKKKFAFGLNDHLRGILPARTGFQGGRLEKTLLREVARVKFGFQRVWNFGDLNRTNLLQNLPTQVNHLLAQFHLPGPAGCLPSLA